MSRAARRLVRPLLLPLVVGLLAATALPAPARASSTVACPSTNQCSFLVNGFAGSEPSEQIYTFDPHAPGFPTPVKIAPYQTYPRLACPTASQCTEWDGTDSVTTFDPAHPGSPAPVKILASPVPGYSSDLACPSVTQCTVVFAGGEVTFNPAAPGTPTPVNVDPGGGGGVLACPSVTQCTLVDRGQFFASEVTFDPTAPGSPSKAAGYLAGSALECPSTTLCVNAYGSANGDGKLIAFDPAAAPNDPFMGTAKSGPLGPLTSCPSTTQCTTIVTANESGGRALTFDPAAYPTIGAQTGLMDKAPYPMVCPSTSECVGIGGYVYASDRYPVPAEITFDPSSSSSPQFVPLAPDRAPAPKPKPTPTPTPAAISAAVSKALAVSGAAAKITAILKTGAYPATLNAPGPGTAQIAWYYVPKGAHVARAKAKPKPALVASGTKTFTKKTKATLKVKLSKKGRAMLKKVKKGHKLKLTAKGSFTPKGSKKTTTKTKAISLKR